MESRALTRPSAISLDEFMDAAELRASEILEERTPENTVKAFKSDLSYWEAYLSAIGFKFDEPIQEKHVRTFIVDHLDHMPIEIDKFLVENEFKQFFGPHRLNTVKRRLANLSVYLQKLKMPNPCKSAEIRKLVRKYSEKGIPNSHAITLNILYSFIATCKDDNAIDIRDKAMLTFGWCSGGRRRSEVTNALYENLRRDSSDFLYFMPESKTDKAKEGCYLPVCGVAAKAMHRWLEVSNIQSGHLFRPIRKNGEIGEGKLPDITLTRIVKKRAQLAGYNPEEYSAHGLRSGFLTEASRRQIPLSEAMELSRHKSEIIASRYYEPGKAMNNLAARLAG